MHCLSIFVIVAGKNSLAALTAAIKATYFESSSEGEEGASGAALGVGGGDTGVTKPSAPTKTYGRG